MFYRKNMEKWWKPWGIGGALLQTKPLMCVLINKPIRSHIFLQHHLAGIYFSLPVYPKNGVDKSSISAGFIPIHPHEISPWMPSGYVKIAKMTIEIVELPIKHADFP
jgi:hypothetical protein